PWRVLRLAVPVRRPAGAPGQARPRRLVAPVVAVVPGSSYVVALEVRVGRGRDRAVQDRHLAENGPSLAIRGVRAGASRRRLVCRTGVLPVSLPAWRGDGDWRPAAPVHALEAPLGMRQPLPAVRKALPNTGHRAERGNQHGRVLLLPRLPGPPQRCERVSAAAVRDKAQPQARRCSADSDPRGRVRSAVYWGSDSLEGRTGS